MGHSAPTPPSVSPDSTDTHTASETARTRFHLLGGGSGMLWFVLSYLKTRPVLSR